MRFLPLWLQLFLGIASVDSITRGLGQTVARLRELNARLDAAADSADEAAERFKVEAAAYRLERDRAAKRADKIAAAFLTDD